MTISILPALEQILNDRAAQLHITVDNLVNQALSYYLQSDPELEAELAGWQEISEEALRLVEDELS